MQEKQIIEVIKSRLSNRLIGDDCAFLPEENLLLSTDALVEGIHFLENINPYDLGWKTAAVNISDVAAMGGLPKYFLLSASLPAAKTNDWVMGLLDGVLACCKQYNVELAGGDLTAAEKVYLCGTIVGKTVNNKVAKRSFAEPGHKIIVCGKFGESAAGLWALQNNKLEKYSSLVKAHLQPEPKVNEGFSLVQAAKTNVAMMDASDGLLDCLKQISEESKVCLKVDLSKLALSPELQQCADEARVDPAEWVLNGGEDYALVATTNEAFDERLWTAIGEVTEGKGVIIERAGKHFDYEALKAFKHFC